MNRAQRRKTEPQHVDRYSNALALLQEATRLIVEAKQENDLQQRQAEAAVKAQPALPPEPTILKSKQVCAATSLSRTSVWLLVRQGKFPAPVSLGGRRRGWKAADITAWVNSR